MRSPTVVMVLTLAITLTGQSLAARPASNCQGTGTGMVPLTDLGTGTYKGFAGGLYPDGQNVPPAAQHDLALAGARAVRPVDGTGQPAADGKVVLLSLGMSNATQEFSAFVQLARGEGDIEPHVVIVDGAQGGQTASIIRDPAAGFWATVDQRLRAAGVNGSQVQVIWLKEANAGPTDPFPGHARSLANDLEAIVHVARDRFPNVKLLYFASRIYAGYASTALNPEPYAYESGFSVRWVIEKQIAGDPTLNADPARGPVTAPVLLWGPYLWADGLTPRGDGLIWRCEDLAADGTHPSTSGRQKVATLLLRFFKSDDTARPWFLADPDAPTPTVGPSFTPPPTYTVGPPTPTPTARYPTPGRTRTATPTTTPDGMVQPSVLYLPFAWGGGRAGTSTE